MTTPSLSIAILAAGKGTRMYSDLPKVLHKLAGKPLVQHVIDTAIQLKARQIHLIYGHGAELIRSSLAEQPVNWVFQQQQGGTGHAAQQIIPFIDDNENILLLYGDTPLVSLETLQRLLSAKPEGGVALLTAELPDPTGYGRIVREQGEITGIIEHKDATEIQRTIKEINTGILVVNGGCLKRWLDKLESNNAQGELYLTDIIAMAYKEGKRIVAVHPGRLSEFEGVNNRLQLATLERTWQLEQAQRLLLEGVMIQDPARFDLRGELIHGRDVFIDVNTIIEGRVELGDRVRIEAGCLLKNCTIGDDCIISPYSIIEDSHLAAGCTVGPFARLRPETRLGERAHVGNFVELKKAQLGKETKSGHLAYLGDAQIGDRVNIGAGTIICNYDGANKHLTTIGDDVFIGSDSQLVAPVAIANGATVAAGTTVTKNVSENELVLSRVSQKHIQNWKRPEKKSKK